MRIDNGLLTLGTKDCFCGDGTVAKRLPCPACKGTGNGPRGGKGGCRKCYGSGTHYDQSVRETCRVCNGAFKDAEPENLCDRLSDEDFRAIPVRVYRSDRTQSWNEAHLGHGCVYSVTDYGAHKQMTDDELVADVRSQSYVQATKVVDRDTMRVCDHIGVFTSDNGFSVRAVFESATEVAADALGELYPDEVHAAGVSTYGAMFARIPR